MHKDNKTFKISISNLTMNKQSLITKVDSMRWDFWLERHIDPFVVYLFLQASTKKAFANIGINGEYPSVIYEKDIWFTNEEMKKEAGDSAKQFLKQKNIFTIVKECEQNYKKSKKQLQQIITNKKITLEEKYVHIYDILLRAAAYIWVTHCSEEYYEPLIRAEVKKYFKSQKEGEAFISQISYSSKKNAHTIMEEWLIKGVDPVKIHKRFGWIKSRFAFRPGYTPEEIKQLQKEMRQKQINKETKQNKIKIPLELRSLVKEIQELVYFRLMRIDAVYELFFLAQPLFDEIARELNIESVKYYFPHDLFKQALIKAPREYAAIKYYDDIIFTKPILNYHVNQISIVKGMIAYQGYAKGKAKIVQSVQDLNKVNEGDIMVTHMTMPPYLPAMHHAAGFVTDEGGITCHAAIVAREMKKPCVIGTKHATKIFNDDDIIELDADKGIVKLVKR